MRNLAASSRFSAAHHLACILFLPAPAAHARCVLFPLLLASAQVLGSLADLASFGFADMSLLAPLGAMTLCVSPLLFFPSAFRLSHERPL